MEINQNTLKQFREDYEQAVKSLEEKYGVVIQAKNITYSDNSFHFKTEVTNGESKAEIRKQDFEKYCSLYGLKPSDYLRSFEKEDNKAYAIIGINPNKRKYPIMIRDLGAANQVYNCSLDFIPFLKKKEWSLPNPKGYSRIARCKYCGKINGDINPDVLCPECQETFGHTLYSEL